ncbi:MAG: hypothetical protein V4676_02860 [Bacteroidota bacterium]
MTHVDVVSDILKAAMQAFPTSEFLQSLAHQYLVRGWLSKKQLEGLYDKAKKAEGMPEAKLATLEAQIKKMPTKTRSIKPEVTEPEVKDGRPGELLAAILVKYPQHKRALFLQSKWVGNQSLTPAEVGEIEKFFKLLA